MQLEYNTLYGQNIFDVLLSTIGDLNLTYKLIQDNGIANIDVDLDSTPNLLVKYEVVNTVPSDIKVSPEVVPSSEVTIVATTGQSVYDVVLMTYGGIEFLYKLLQDNGVDNISVDLNQKNIVFDSTLIVDNFVYLKNQNGGIRYATLEAVSGVNTSGGLLNDDGIQLQTDDGIDIIVD